MFPRHGKLLVSLLAFVLGSTILFWYAVPNSDDFQSTKLIEQRVDSLNKRLHDNERLMEELKRELKKKEDELLKADKPSDGFTKVAVPTLQLEDFKNDQSINEFRGNKVQKVRVLLRKKQGQSSNLSNFCPAKDLVYNSTADVQMLSVYEILPFDNVDGGVWKQGWNIEYDSSKVHEEKRLKVFVVPHSHTDPGWLKTFDEYYAYDTRIIFNNMHKHLMLKTDMKFIYPDMCFFEMWWSEINEQMRDDVRKLAKNGQLEIVTGGWVMTDEANSNYYSTIMELIEGHEFLQNQLDITPKNHLSIDPFGLSSTIPYLLNRANFSNMAINRVHYSVKKHLAHKKQLEFKWRQLFAKNADTDITVNMFPFFSYDVPHTCGPDPKVCCQFDFRRLHAFGCPWGKLPKAINDENIAERASLLADQYRKKSQLYGTNTLLIPLGDDFRYNTEQEWNDQYVNYRKLMEFINQKSEWNMKVSFGTLEDYFTTMRSRLANTDQSVLSNNFKDEGWKLPVLSGDFFTYADRDDHYWSGYFTSRPFYKHMDRTLQHYIRTAEILFGWAFSKSTSEEEKVKYSGIELYDQLVEARRALGLFQHHDAVAGTARAYVFEDYAQKMLSAIDKCKSIITTAVQYLYQLREDFLKIDEKHFTGALPKKTITQDGSSIVVFNSLAQTRRQVTCIYVNSDKSRIRNDNGKIDVHQQIGPVLYVDEDTNRIRAFEDKFELCFLALLPAMGFAKYEIFEAEDTSHKVTLQSSKNFNSNSFETKLGNRDSDLALSNQNLKAFFNSNTGLLKKIVVQSREFSTNISFVKYIPRGRKKNQPGDSLPGAYLFLPNASATTLSADNNEYVLVNGALRQYLFTRGPSDYKISHIVSLDVNDHFLSIENNINLGNKLDEEHRSSSPVNDIEIAMRITSTSSASLEEKFFTDLNNFQMIRRRRFEKLPIQAQFYPMSGAAFLEDQQRRISLLGRQAIGVSSLKPGTLEVMLDRTLTSDDDRGLAEGVLDNKHTLSQFRLFIEPLLTSSPPTNNNEANGETIGYHSAVVNFAQLLLHYPPVILTGQLEDNNPDEFMVPQMLADSDFACDVHIVGIRTMSQPTLYGSAEKLPLRKTKPNRSLALILHRFGTDCRFGDESAYPTLPFKTCRKTFGEADLSNVFAKLNAKSIRNSSLTLLYRSVSPLTDRIQTLEPMELRTVLVDF